LGASMSEWKLHAPDESNRITRYKCGLVAGERVRLKRDLVVTTSDGVATGNVYPAGEEWVVLVGIASDPVLWFRQADGERHTWDDDPVSVDEWFERLPPQ
jgi:hypothetical protein